MTLTDFPDEISPFPDAENLLYDHRSSLGRGGIHSVLPRQKLRPIRNNGDSSEYFNPPTSFCTELLPENGNLAGNDEQVVVTAPPDVRFRSDVLPLQWVPPGGSNGQDLTFKCDSPASVANGELISRREGGGGGGGGSGGGNRWPEEETLALLRVRLEMDAQFRDSNPKGPLWEIISMKLGQMGYSRDSRKCKEKFENVYKYYKRTKEKLQQGGSLNGRKIYKFFSELEALDNLNNENAVSGARLSENAVTFQLPEPVEIANKLVGSAQTSSSGLLSLFSSSGDDEVKELEDEFENDEDVNDDELNEGVTGPINGKRKRKTGRKVERFLENLADKMMKKQEEMYAQLIEIIDKKEKERIIREEAWRLQEMEREKREQEMRDQETARSLTLICFIGKVLGQQIEIPQLPESTYSEEDQEEKHDQKECKFDLSNKKWLKSEVQALITLRTLMDRKYRNATLKNSVWEEVSVAMSSMGYGRSAKKCKEKWENMNKYFKRALGSGKKRPESAKTCPYFQELSILYNNGILDLGSSHDEMNSEGESRSTDQVLDSPGVSNVVVTSQTVEPES